MKLPLMFVAGLLAWACAAISAVVANLQKPATSFAKVPEVSGKDDP